MPINNGAITVSIGSGMLDTAYGNCQVPIKKYLEKRAEAFEQASVLDKLFRMEKSKHWAEGYSGETAMDDFRAVGEGGSYPQTDFQESFKKTIENETFKQSFSVTQELVEDAQIGTMQARANKLVTAYYRTREKLGRAIYAGALAGTTVQFNGKTFSCASADGKKAFATNHNAKVKGADQSNLFADDISAATLGKLETRMQNYCGDTGELLAIAPNTILIPNDAVLKAKVFEAIGSSKDPDTANNGFNYQFGRWNVICDPYLKAALDAIGITDKPWFLIDSEFMQLNDGAIFQDRIKLEVKSDIDKTNDNNVWRGRARFSAGVADWRGFAVGGMTGGASL